MAGGPARRAALMPRAPLVITLSVTIVGSAVMASDAAAVGGAKPRLDWFGTTSTGAMVNRVTLSNDRGMRVVAIAYGATLTGIEVPDRDGRLRNVVLSLPTMTAFEATKRRWGGVLGRYAGRIGNSAFVLDGRRHRLEPGRNGVTLHSGSSGFDRRLWDVSIERDLRSSAAVFRLVSPDGDGGFPGRLTIVVTYRLMRRSNILRIGYRATTTAPTVLNLTNHMFVNLSGAGESSIASHILRLRAERYAETDARQIPTGRLLPVPGTMLDFGTARAIDPERSAPIAFDQSYVLRDWPTRRPRRVACLYDPQFGRRLRISTTEPAIQLNSGDAFDGSETGSEGVAYRARSGLALEAQHLPDSPNQPAFASTVLRPGRAFHSVTELRFSAQSRTNKVSDEGCNTY